MRSPSTFVSIKYEKNINRTNRKISHLPMASPSPVLCFLLLIAAFSLQIKAQTSTNITISDQPLVANDAISLWRRSPSGDFAVGFQKLPTGSFLLAIWFDQIPEKTIVWSANRDKLAPPGSKVQLTTAGLVLRDPQGEEIWSDSFTGSEVSYAAMLDTGNFVVANQDSDNVWETFANPTDTILPTQTLNQGTRLVSRYADKNYSMGRFQLSMQTDGNLVLYIGAVPALNRLYGSYWSTNTVDGYQLIFNQTGEVYLSARNGAMLSSIAPSLESSKVLYQRAVLDYDGVFRKYGYLRNGSTEDKWTLRSNPIPVDICSAITLDIGGGVCGVNSYCILDDDEQQTPRCRCPEKYIKIDPENEMSGCKPSFEPQSCNADMSEANQFMFKTMSNTNWPLADYDRLQLDESQCRQSCLNDCFCYLAIMNEGGDCWKKKMPFTNGRMNPSLGGTTALIKFRKDNSTSKQGPQTKKKKDDATLIIIGSVLLGTSGALNLLLLWFRSQGIRKEQVLSPSIISEGTSVQNFTYQDLKEATDGFKEELGKGAFGAVYRGAISSSRGRSSSLIAVKVLNKLTEEGDKEFKAEVNTISRTNHKNLVQLIGFCNEGQQRLLVYEFMPNGSLASNLFGTPRPSWFRRVEIACGVARGLLYLHEECSKQIIHCDIKPQNILLDNTFTAKISDFGLAKLLMTDQTRTVTAIRGTKGYLAPEWFRNMPISVKVDVYSFGILLLELICCRKSCELDSSEERRVILSDWVSDCYREGNLHLLVQDDEEAQNDMKRVQRFTMTAMWCIQEDPSLRPPMKKIIQMLEGAVEVSVPPDPSSFISAI